MRNRIGFIGVGLLLGALLGGVIRSGLPTRVPILQAPKSAPSPLNEGYDPLITVELEPSAVLKDSAGERIEYELAITPRAGAKSDVAIQYSTELVGDDGSQLQPPDISAVMTVAATSGHSRRMTTPPRNRDGYFVLRIQAGASDSVEDTLQIAERYFRVNHGAVMPVTADEYFTNSNASLARRGS